MPKGIFVTIALGCGLALATIFTTMANAATPPSGPKPERRVALVIGNSNYQSVTPLPNPVKDAGAIAELFTRAGFEVVKARNNVGNLEFKRALREFVEAASDSDVAVVYYAGHGIQIGDMNYMIPVDAKLAKEFDAKDEAVSLERIIEALEPARKLRLLILDACRDNPFLAKMQRRVAMRAAQVGGLGNMEPTTTDTLIAYAAKAGSTAEDGDGANSPFAAALIKHITEPGLDIRLAFGRVRDDVRKATGGRQEPFMSGSLGGTNISLVPAPVVPVAAPEADVRKDYELVASIGTKKAWEVFINTHKTGFYVDLARAQIAKAEPQVVVPPQQQHAMRAVPSVETPARERKETSDERRAWDRVKDKGDPAAIRKFIEKYPSSPLVTNAERLLDTLERAAQEREQTARAEREAREQREAADAERKRTEREAARQRDAEEKRAKAEEADRKKVEREAARQKEDDRKKAEREAARQREDDEKRAKAAKGTQPVQTEAAKSEPSDAEIKAAERAKAEREAAAKRNAEAKAAEERRRAEQREAAREAAEERRAEQRSQERRREAAREKQQSERRRSAEREKPQRSRAAEREPARSAPPRARAEASARPAPRFSGGGGGGTATMTGVGF